MRGSVCLISILLCGYFFSRCPYRNSEARSHPIEIVRVLAHHHHLRHDCVIRPLHAEDFGQLLQVLSRGFADGEDGVAEPAHAQAAELLVEELNAQLACEERNVFDDG